MKRILLLSLFVAVISGCTSMKDSNTATRVTATGTIEKLGMTTFQYGTHILKAENKTYALKSTRINLDTYINKKVTIKGNKVSGYPLEGGPELIDVTLVQF
ncbi:hypothetical protein FA048_14920 [Pedobacter polaris]|uniref:Uncharacterized protein n=1 Tax=Pedobacter polaris TaxID=2571273 RepID=A0A4V5P0T4_9SPHI|nr:hypothetical protein [Pedobacter polaris]TKC06506.1 hypothetical protein FA048_14920 [Pedobacter polaris]